MPHAVEADFGRVVGRRVELVGQHAVGRRRLGDDVALVDDDPRPVSRKLVQQLVEVVGVVGLEPQARVRGLGLGAGPTTNSSITYAGALVVGDEPSTRLKSPSR